MRTRLTTPQRHWIIGVDSPRSQGTDLRMTANSTQVRAACGFPRRFAPATARVDGDSISGFLEICELARKNLLTRVVPFTRTQPLEKEVRRNLSSRRALHWN